MYCHTTKWCTNVNERHNALNASDHQAFEVLQAMLLFSFIQEHRARQLLSTSFLLGCHEDHDDTIFSLCLLNYQQKKNVRRILLTMEFFYMTIFPEQRVPRPLMVPINRTFASLDPTWCYRYTRFTNHQLQHLYELLNLPPRFVICGGKCHCSSEEAFIVTMVKVATGDTNLGLQAVFGECNDQRISDIYNHTISWLNGKAAGLFNPPCLEQWKDNFPTFASFIEQKLGEEAYGGLQFNNFRIIGFVDCKISETCCPGSGPAEDRQLAPRHDDAEILQESVYSGYVRRHGLKILTVVFPNGIIGYLYGPISARENDNGALNGSELNQHLIDLQDEITRARERGEQVLYFSLYGDAIFPLLHCITRRHRAPIGGQLNARQIAEDSGMSRIRTSVEWPYETATNLFHVLHSKYNKHLLKHGRAVNEIVHKQLRVVFYCTTATFV